MRYTGIQPQYFPRLHYFARILATDIFVLRDDAQFVAKHKYPDGRIKPSYQCHTPIKTEAGEYLLTIPIKHTGYAPIAETQIEYSHDWVRIHCNTLKYVYKKAINFRTIFPEIEALLSTSYTTLAQLATATVLWGILRLMDIPLDPSGQKNQLTLDFVEKKLAEKKLFRLTRIKKASILAQEGNFTHLVKNEKIIAIMKAIGTSEDYSGGTAMQAYIDENIFEKNNIHIIVQNWKCAAYPQFFTKNHPFIPNLSIIDLLMNVPVEQARTILASHD